MCYSHLVGKEERWSSGQNEHSYFWEKLLKSTFLHPPQIHMSVENLISPYFIEGHMDTVHYLQMLECELRPDNKEWNILEIAHIQ